MTDEHPQILKTEQVAELLGMSVDMVRRAARDGTLPAYRLPGGRTHRFFRNEILEWLRSRPPAPGLKPAPQPEAPATPGVVQQAVRAAVSEGQALYTPTRQAPFKVDKIDTDGLVLLMGKGEWATRLSWEHLEGVVPYIRQHGGVVDIGGRSPGARSTRHPRRLSEGLCGSNHSRVGGSAAGGGTGRRDRQGSPVTGPTARLTGTVRPEGAGTHDRTSVRRRRPGLPPVVDS
jgi:excisionase family DNA binding protein